MIKFSANTKGFNKSLDKAVKSIKQIEQEALAKTLKNIKPAFMSFDEVEAIPVLSESTINIVLGSQQNDYEIIDQATEDIMQQIQDDLQPEIYRKVGALLNGKPIK